MTNDIKIIKGDSTATSYGSFDYNSFDQISFDAGLSYAQSIKIAKPISFKVLRGNATSFSIRMRLTN